MESNLEKGSILPFQLKKLDPLLPEGYPGFGYGFVLDLGTTTLGFYLLNLENGELLSEEFLPNPGAVYGIDILNRVKTVIQEPAKLQQIQKDLIDVVNSGICKSLAKFGLAIDQVWTIVVIGNPIMIHLFYGVNPSSLSRAPFTLEMKGNRIDHSRNLGISSNPSCLIATPPLITAFIGSDILCGIISSLSMEISKPFLFCDLGTNAEIALILENKILATSAAAGPAFEDFDLPLNIVLKEEFIKHLRWSEEGGFEIEGKPGRFLATAKIDAIAFLREIGILEPSGLLRSGGLVKDEIKSRLKKNGKGISFFEITPGLIISQEEVRHFQLAKAAIKTAIEFLLEAAGIEFLNIRKILFSGTFGSMVLPSSAAKVGLIPQELENRVIAAGNAAARGGILFLLNEEYRRMTVEISQIVEVVRLTKNPRFKEVFLKALEFPF